MIAGFINKGENVIEIKEDVDLNLIDYIYNNKYFERATALICHYVVIIKGELYYLAKSFVERIFHNI